MFDEVLLLDVNFHWLDLTRGSFYIPLPSGIVGKKAVINPKNENDEKCLKWAVTTSLHYKEIKSHPEHVSNIVGYADNYNWSRLEFLVAINKINDSKRTTMTLWLMY